MNNKKQTAVEWLEEALAENLKQIIVKSDTALMESLFAKAKAMQNKQHETSFKAGFKYRSYIHDSIYGGADKWEGVPKNFDDYYNETYGGNNE